MAETRVDKEVSRQLSPRIDPERAGFMSCFYISAYMLVIRAGENLLESLPIHPGFYSAQFFSLRPSPICLFSS